MHPGYQLSPTPGSARRDSEDCCAQRHRQNQAPSLMAPGFAPWLSDPTAVVVATASRLGMRPWAGAACVSCPSTPIWRVTSGVITGRRVRRGCPPSQPMPLSRWFPGWLGSAGSASSAWTWPRRPERWRARQLPSRPRIESKPEENPKKLGCGARFGSLRTVCAPAAAVMDDADAPGR